MPLSGNLRNGMTSGAVLTIGPNVTVRGQGTVSGNGFGGGGGIVNQGTIRADAVAGTLQLRQVTNAGGLIRAMPGNTIHVAVPSTGETTFVQTAGELSAADAGTITSIRGIDVRGGKLGGVGAVRLTSDTAANNFVRASTGGAIAPGDSVGMLTIDGNVIIGDGGRLAIELSGASSDLLTIVKGQFQPAAGDLDLSSTTDFLDVTTLATPTASSYLIASYAGTLSGTFNTVTPGYSVTYDTAQKKLFLNVVAVTDSAKFDADNDVDGNDFLVWQRGLGLGPGATQSQGDASHDGSVTGADLTVWRNQFGTASSVAASGAVPEPPTAALALAVLIGATAFGRRHWAC